MTDNSGALPPPPFQPPPGQPQNPPAEGRGRRPWWIIGGGVGVLVVVLGTVAALSGGGDDDSESASTESTAVETTQASPTTEAAVESTISTAAQSRCGYLGLDDFGDMQVEVEFANPLGSVPSVEVTFALLDSSGTRFHTDGYSFDLPLVDEVFRADVDTVTRLPADVEDADVSCQVLDIREGFGYDDVQPPSESSSCEVADIDRFGDIQIVLATTSPFDATESMNVYYALRGSGGVRFDDSYASVEFVAPGESIRVTEDTMTEVPNWTTEDDVSCSVLGVRASDF